MGAYEYNFSLTRRSGKRVAFVKLALGIEALLIFNPVPHTISGSCTTDMKPLKVRLVILANAASFLPAFAKCMSHSSCLRMHRRKCRSCSPILRCSDRMVRNSRIETVRQQCVLVYGVESSTSMAFLRAVTIPILCHAHRLV